MSLSVRSNINEEKKGLELLFSKKLSKEDATYLKEYVGFRKTVDPLRWYTKYLNQPAYQQYVEELPDSKSITQTKTKPSFEGNLQNLDEGKYILADYSFRNADKLAFDTFIIFENSPIAKHIAMLLGNEKYGENFKNVSIKKTGIKRKGLELLKKGQFIDNSFEYKKDDLLNEKEERELLKSSYSKASEAIDYLTDNQPIEHSFQIEAFSVADKYYKSIPGKITFFRNKDQINFSIDLAGKPVLGSGLLRAITSVLGNSQFTDLLLPKENEPSDQWQIIIDDGKGNLKQIWLKDFLLQYFSVELDRFRISKQEYERIISTEFTFDNFIKEITEEFNYLDNSLDASDIDELLKDHEDFLNREFLTSENERLTRSEIAYLLIEKRINQLKAQSEKQTPKESTQPDQQKIPLQKILVTIEGNSSNPDFTKGEQFDSWQKADEFARKQLGKVSDVHYQVNWQDGMQWPGSVDMEPVSFHQGRQIFPDWTITFLTNLSKAEPGPLANNEQIAFAKQLLEQYSFSDLETTTIAVPDFNILLQAFSEQQKRKIGQPLASVEEFGNWLKTTHPEIDDELYQSNTGQYQQYVDRAAKNQQWIDRLGRRKSVTSIFNTIYNKLLKLIPNLEEHLEQASPAGKSKLGWPESGLMDLSYDYLGSDNGIHTIALAHNYIENGDLIADPDMEISIDTELKTAKALSFQDRYSYKTVYSEENGKQYVNNRLKQDLNKFLNTWLGNALKQGHQIAFEESDQTPENEPETEPAETQQDSTNNADPLVNQSYLSNLGKTPDSYLVEFDQLHANEAYEQAAEVLSHLIWDISSGFYQEFLPEVIIRFSKKGLKTLLKKKGYPNLSEIIKTDEFKENLNGNLWDLIPDFYKKARAEKVLQWKADPKDPNLQKIMAPFVGDDLIRVEEMGVYFDDHGLVATDRIKLIFLPGAAKRIRGSYCLTKKCQKNFNDHYEEIYGIEPFDQQAYEKFQQSVAFPNYQSALKLFDISETTSTDLSPLQVFCHAMLKSQLLEPNHKIYLKFKEGFIGLDATHLSTIVSSLQRLGLSKAGLYCESSVKALFFFQEGTAEKVKKLQTAFAMMMPLFIEQIEEPSKVDQNNWVQAVTTGSIYFDITDRKAKTYTTEQFDQHSKLAKEPEPDQQQKPDQQANDQTIFEKQIIAVSNALFELYRSGKRPSKGKITDLAKNLGITHMGLMWELTEYSWLQYYRLLNAELAPFTDRLAKMIAFWNHLQPSYDYSDSSKELYKQYSTPCPIGAIVGQYCFMDRAERIFDPSAGNGLLVMGADEEKTHVNEIDPTRRSILEFQNFKTVTAFNATEPFDESLTQSFDVVVTNPPFTKWDDDQFDKKYLVKKYFNSYRGLSQHMRLEHLMCGLALHTLKNEGKAAMIILGHVYFDQNGLIAKYRPFFNWLYAHYYVDDVINLNGFTLYNKQGAVPKTMLILISGRKPMAFLPIRNRIPD